MAKSDDTIVTVTEAIREAARLELYAMVRDGRWVENYEGEHDLDADDEIVVVTPEMAATARDEVSAMIAEGRWPEPYDGDDQVIFDNDEPEAAGTLKAAE